MEKNFLFLYRFSVSIVLKIIVMIFSISIALSILKAESSYVCSLHKLKTFRIYIRATDFLCTQSHVIYGNAQISNDLITIITT